MKRSHVHAASTRDPLMYSPLMSLEVFHLAALQKVFSELLLLMLLFR